MAMPQHVDRLSRWLFGARFGAPAQPAASAPEAPATPTQPPAGPWSALPGNVIELRTSGFQIQLDTRPGHPLYTLRSPEGTLLAYGSNLPGLKELGERLAAERDEFVFRGALR